MNSPGESQKDVITTDDPATAIFTSFAKVYTMNPNNKTFWLPSSTAAVPVSFYFDKHRSVYRVISYDKKDLVVNSTIYPAMTFIKTSATFGLWSDTKLRTIYGLGFTSNEHLVQFAEWFEKIVKAAKKLEDNLPLPPPAPSAVSIDGEDSFTSATSINPNTIGPPDSDLAANGTNSNSSGTTICSHAPGFGGWYEPEAQNRNYVPPKTVHVVDSTIDLAVGGNRGDGDYEIDQMTSSTMAKLALENLQYQREVLKVKQLEIELHSMRTTVNTMHEALQKKSTECEKFRKELTEANSEIESQKNQLAVKQEVILKLQESEVELKEKVEALKMQNDEKEKHLVEKKDEVKYLKTEVEKGNDVQKENDILKERLRQLQTEFDISDKNWDIVEMASCDMTDVIQGLIGIQDRLKHVIPTASGGDM